MDLRQKAPFFINYTSGYLDTVSSTSPLSLPKAKANGLKSVTLYGATSQANTPTPSDPVDIVCNNGALKWDSVNQTVYADGTVETIEDTIGNTATAEMLLKVGDYQDQQGIIAGTVTRNVRVKVLDGTEVWDFDTNNCFRANSLLPQKVYSNAQSYCTHYDWSDSSPANLNNWKFCLHGTERFVLKDNRFETVEDLKTFLADQYANGTPVIVVYPLATPTTESVAGQTLQTQAGTNTLTITQAALNGLTLSATYKRGK